MRKNKGFTLIELLTVIAILAVILLIAAPVILGVLDKARKNTFKNQVLLYVEGLKQQTALAAMGQGYSELQKIDTAFYSPTSDSTGKIVRVSISSLNKIMDNAILSSDEDKYMYVEWSDNGYNYYIGEGVEVIDGYQTTCSYATGKEACEDKVYNNENIKLINSKVLGLVHIERNDVTSSNTGGSTSSGTSAPFGYSTSEGGYNSSDSSTLSLSRPTTHSNYLKYQMVNGVVPEGTVPETCLYSTTYGGELCLKNNELAVSSPKITSFFGYDASSWVNTVASTWVNDKDNPTITCQINDSYTVCSDDYYNVIAYNHGVVDITEKSTNFDCYVVPNNFATCVTR